MPDIHVPWRCLNGWKTDFAHCIGIAKTKNAFDLIISYRLLNSEHIPIKFFTSWNIIQIREYKCSVHIKTTGNNVLTNV